MEQRLIIKVDTTLEKLSLIAHLPIEFSINERRKIKFRLPTLKEYLNDLDFKKFLGIISLTPEKIKDLKIKVQFQTDSVGGIVKGFMYLSEYKELLMNYFCSYIDGAEIKDGLLSVQGEEVTFYELEYIVKVLLVSMYMEKLDENLLTKKIEIKKETDKELSPAEKKLLEKQKLAEEKLRKAKESKSTGSGSGLAIEEILLAISYEFGTSFEELLNRNYYSIIWQFGYVGKIDSHKLHQIIMGTGNSKNKNYSYWLSNKKK
jgi:hypothetical protein